MTLPRLTVCVGLACLAGLAGNLHAQTTLAFATYGSDSPAAGTLDATSGAVSLDTVTVTAIIGSNVYVEDSNTATSGVGGELYISGFSAETAVGDTYSGLTGTQETYYGDPETVLSALPGLPASTGNAVSYVSTTAAAVDKVISPADTTGGTTGKYTEQLGYLTLGAYAPINFTLTTGSSAYTFSAVGGSDSAYTDASGDVLDFYDVATTATPVTLAANSTYTVTAVGEAYSSTTYEIQGASFTATAAAPEPPIWLLLGIGLLALGMVARFRTAARQGCSLDV
jgi:hypothetical protein